MASRSVLFFIALAIITQCYVETTVSEEPALSADVSTTTAAGVGADEMMSTTPDDAPGEAPSADVSTTTAAGVGADEMMSTTPDDAPGDAPSEAAAVTSTTPETPTVMTCDMFPSPFYCTLQYEDILGMFEQNENSFCAYRSSILSCVETMESFSAEDQECTPPSPNIRAAMESCPTGSTTAAPGFVPSEDFDCTDPMSCVNDYTAGLPGDANFTAIVCEHREAIRGCVALMIQYADQDCVLPDSSIRADLSMCSDDAEDDGLTDGVEAAQVAAECMIRIQSCFPDSTDTTTDLPDSAAGSPGGSPDLPDSAAGSPGGSPDLPDSAAGSPGGSPDLPDSAAGSPGGSPDLPDSVAGSPGGLQETLASFVQLCRTQMETIDCVFDVASSDYCRSNPYVQETLPSYGKTRLLQNYQCAKYMSCSSSAISECATLSDIIVVDSESEMPDDASQTALCAAYNQTVGCTESLEDSCKLQWLSTGAIADLYSDVNRMCQDEADADDCAYSTDPLQCIEDYSATFDITNPDPETKCIHKTEIMTCVELMEVYHDRHQCISPDPAIRSALSTCPDDVDGEDPTAALEASSCLLAAMVPCGASAMFEEDHVMLFNDSESCRINIEQVTCMIEHLTNSICSSNILILQQMEAFSMTRMYMNYKCTSTLECSREIMSSCMTDRDVFDGIVETDPMGPMDNMEELCTAFNESVLCTASLPTECRSTWVTDEELLAMAHEVSLKCEEPESWDCSNPANEYVCTSGEFNTDVENNYCLNKDEILDCVTQLEERTSDEGCVGPSSLYRSYLAECPPETTSMPNGPDEEYDCSSWLDPFECVEEFHNILGSFEDNYPIYCVQKSNILSCVDQMDRLSSIPNCVAPDPSIKQKMEACPDDDFTDVENFSQYIIDADTCFNHTEECRNILEDGEPTTPLEACTYSMQEANCVLGILEDESNNCHNNALVQSSVTMYKKMRLMRSYECAADIDCSRVSMRGCMVSEATLDDLISRDTIGNLSITNDICNVLDDSVACIEELDIECVQTWMPNGTISAMLTDIVSLCENVNTGSGGGGDGDDSSAAALSAQALMLSLLALTVAWRNQHV